MSNRIEVFEDLATALNPGNPEVVYEKIAGMIRPDDKFQATTGRWEIATGLVTQDQAIAAGEQALEIIRHADRLPYAETTDFGTRSHTLVGVFDHEQYPKSKETIFAYDRSREWAADLLDVVGAMQAAWPQLRYADYIALDLYQPGEHLSEHQDLRYDYTGIMELMFGSVISLYDNKLRTKFVQPQVEGDAYIMHHTENAKWSPYHEVEFPWARLALRMEVTSPVQGIMDLKKILKKEA
jgi:alkylated DNA repair dioxygenase AlkB